MKIESPCIQVCELDGCGVCLGCFRTLDEIARWRQMDACERTSIINVLEERRIMHLKTDPNE